MNILPRINICGGLTRHTAARSLLGAITLLALLGIRYPLKMMPLLFFEMLWKSIWLLAFALPRWSAGTMDQNMQGELYSYIFTVIILAVVLPWPYVFNEYIRSQGDRWKKQTQHDEPYS